MKFLIQKIDGEIRHDFSFTLIESIRYHNWIYKLPKDQIKVKYCLCRDGLPIIIKPQFKNYVPIGSVEFVNEFLTQFHNTQLKPVNVPEELFCYTSRAIVNADETYVNSLNGQWFVKSNDKIKAEPSILNCGNGHKHILPKGNYQYSEVIKIESEWRVFVYNHKLVGLHNYSGDFIHFPDVTKIIQMIGKYSKTAPITYTLDVAIIGKYGEVTCIIESHPMISVGLYGFADHKILPYMFHRGFKECLKKL